MDFVEAHKKAILALLNQNMNQAMPAAGVAIAAIKLVPDILSGTEPYLR